MVANMGRSEFPFASRTVVLFCPFLSISINPVGIADVASFVNVDSRFFFLQQRSDCSLMSKTFKIFRLNMNVAQCMQSSLAVSHIV